MRKIKWLRSAAVAVGLVAHCGSSALSKPPVVGPARISFPARSPKKASAPVDLELLVLSGGRAGERTKVLLWAEPQSPRGQLNLDLVVPEGVAVVSGSTSEQGAYDGGTRLIQIEVDVPPTGVHRLLGKARWTLPGGQVWTRGIELLLPQGSVGKSAPSLPMTVLPNGGYRIDLPGKVGP